MTTYEELDVEKIQELQELGHSGADITSLVQLFQRRSAERLVLLRSAVESGEVEVVGQTAHSLRGSTGNVGAWRVAELCKTIELAARRSELPSIETIEEVDNLLTLARAELERVFPSRLDSDRSSEQ